MAEGGGFDFNKLAQAMGLGMGGGGASDDSFIDGLANKMASLVAKLTGFIPNFSNPQQSSPVAVLDKKEGIQDKMINQGAKSVSAKRDTPLNSTLAKHITRDATGIHSAEKETLARMDPHIEGLPVGDSRFDYSSASVASLGTFSSPYTPSSGISYESGIGGVA